MGYVLSMFVRSNKTMKNVLSCKITKFSRKTWNVPFNAYVTGGVRIGPVVIVIVTLLNTLLLRKIVVLDSILGRCGKQICPYDPTGIENDFFFYYSKVNVFTISSYNPNFIEKKSLGKEKIQSMELHR